MGGVDAETKPYYLRRTVKVKHQQVLFHFRHQGRETPGSRCHGTALVAPLEASGQNLWGTFSFKHMHNLRSKSGKAKRRQRWTGLIMQKYAIPKQMDSFQREAICLEQSV